ncbi:MAG TPA: alkaline phosphatase family protein [Candidatus Cybelea sp.]|jgi:phospholipase C|nr:alkaline phosphatase family protein [Candidatus Cybelea sp.]
MVGKPPFLLALVTLSVAWGCSFNGTALGVGGGPAVLPAVRPALGRPASTYISHVIVIVQENRSFENFFAGYPGADAPLFGCASGSAHASTAAQSPVKGSACPRGDNQVDLHAIKFIGGPDLQHDWHSSMVDWDHGKMDGFWKYGNHGPDEAYAYVEHSEIKPYYAIANQYVLADAMFPTEFGGSFTAHLTLVAGTDNISRFPSEAEVDFPSQVPDDCDAPKGTVSTYLTSDRVEHYSRGPYPCFDQFHTIAEDLDRASVSWKYYSTKLVGAGFWEPFEAMKYVRYGPDWHKNIIVPQTKILTDPGAGKLAEVSWVMPSPFDSDHPAYPSDRGPSWVASIVNAIGESPYWKSSAIIVVWDDWGGFYDNAPPPQLDYRGLGIRIPCLIISPYTRKTSSSHQGYVSHTQYEFGSILKFIEEVFNLGSIGQLNKGYTDSRANSVIDSFDFTQQPRPFKRIPTKYPPSVFLHEPPSDQPLDTE